MRLLSLAAALTLLGLSAPEGARADIFTPCFEADPQADSWGAIDACMPLARDDRWAGRERGEAWLVIGKAHSALGLTDQARAELLHAAELFPAPLDDTRTAWALHGAGYPAEAERLYDAALKADPHMRHAWLARCVVRQEQEKWRASIGDCRRAYDMQQRGEDVLYFLSRAFVMVDDPVNAVNFTRFATQEYPGSGRIWVVRVWAEEIAGHREAARRLARDRLRKDAGNVGLQNYLRRSADAGALPDLMAE